MYPAIPVEMYSGVVSLLSYFFTLVAVLVTLAVAARN
jgi:hypothetical protein